MAHPLQLLLVEDDPSEVRSILTVLEGCGLRVEACVAATREELQEALRVGGWHAVLSDYTTPGICGLEALDLYRTSGLDVPFLVVSGTIGEEKAAGCIRAGAWDCVSKEHLGRLPAVLLRELRLAETRRAQRQTELELEESRARYAHIVESTAEGIVLTDGAGAVRSANPAACELFGLSEEEMQGRVLQELMPPAGQGERRSSSAPPGETRIGCPDGSFRRVEVTVSPMRGTDGKLYILTDLTARRDLEAQLQRSQRMEAVGRLAAGVAHDFNNLLQAIVGTCSLLLQGPGLSGACRGGLEEILRSSASAATLTRQLLALGRRRPPEAGVVDLNEAVRSVQLLLERALGDDVTLRVRLHEGPCLVRGTAEGLEQILLNLAVNARDAMPRGGVLSVTTEVHREPGPPPPPRPGPYTLLRVADTGTGMDETVLAHLFEPFFTTKEPGRGTGLGLANVYGLVRQMDGCIRVHSRPGQGSRFDILLPCCRNAPRVERAPDPGTPRAGEFSGREMVLVVDDSHPVLSLLQRILGSRGYRVATAGSAEEALALTAKLGHLDALVTDMVLPGLGGDELASRLRRSHPEVAVLLTSGYSHETLEERIPDGAAFLEKPFTPASLLRALRDVLDARNAAEEVR